MRRPNTIRLRGQRSAVSIRRRSCRSSFLRCGLISELSSRNNLFRQRFETWIAVQWIEQRINSDPSDVRTGAIPIGLFEPAKRLLFFAEPEIDQSKAVVRDVLLFG